MLLFLKVALAVAASLFGVYQVADKLDLPTHLTLTQFEHAQPYLAFFGLGPAEWSPDLNVTGSTNAMPASASNAPDSVMLGDNIAAATALGHSPLPTDIPVVLSAHKSSTQNDPSWGNIKSQPDQAAALSGRFFVEKMATLNFAVDYLFSFVEQTPTSAWESLQFSLAAVFVVGFVFVLGTACYWALRLFDVRGLTASNLPKLLPIGTETALPASGSEELDVPSIISDIVQSVLTKTSPPETNSSLFQTMPMEILAFATEIAQVRSDIVPNDSANLRNEIGNAIENNNSEIKRVAELGDHQIMNARNEFEAHMKSKLDSLRPIVDSKAETSFVLNLGDKLNKVTADTESVKQDMANSVSKHDTNLSKVFKNFHELQIDFQKLDKNLTKQRSENSRLLKILDEHTKAHEAEALKAREEADQRFAKVMDELKDLKKDLLQKADGSICTRLEGKITNVKESFGSRFGKLQTNLETVQKDLASDAETVGARLEKQQVDLEDMKDRLGSKVDVVGKEIEEQQGNLEQIRKTLSSKVESKAFKELQNHLNGFVKNRQLEELKHQVGAISSQANNKADSSMVATLEKQVANKVAADTFVAFKTQTTGELSALSRNVDKQLSTKVSIEDLNKVKEEVVVAQSELDSIVAQLPAMVDINEFKGLRAVVDAAQSELKACQAQLLVKATVEDFGRLKETMAKARSDLSSVAERLREKAETVDLDGLETAVENMRSGLTALENKLPVIEGMDFSQVKDTVDFFKRQTEDIRRLVENKVEDRTFAELESRVDSMAEKSSLAEFRMSIDEKMADMWDALSITTGAHLSKPKPGEDMVELGTSFAEVSIKREGAAKPSTAAGQCKKQNEDKPESPADNVVASPCKPLHSDSSVMPDLAKGPDPTNPSVSVQQNTMTDTSESSQSTTAVAQALPGESDRELKKTATASAAAQTQSSGSDDSTHAVQDLAGFPAPSEKPSVNGVSQPSNQSAISSEQSSKLHEPTIRIDPEAAAKGATALMASRFASPERLPLADKTNVTRASSPGTAKAVGWVNAPSTSISDTKSSSDLAESKWAQPQQAQRAQPPGNLGDSRWAPSQQPAPQQAQRAQPPGNLGDSRWAPSQQPAPQRAQRAQPPGNLGDSRWAPSKRAQRSAPPGGISDSKWASPQGLEVQQSAPSVEAPTPLANSRWAQAPAFSPSSATSRPPTQPMNFRWADEPETEVPFVESQISGRLSSTTGELCGPSNRNPPRPDLTSQDASRTPAGEMQLTALPDSGQASAPPQVEAANAASAVPLGPKTPKVRPFAPGKGPGPNGGQRNLTENTRCHNLERRNANQLSKALGQFTKSQQLHARQRQNRVTRLFAVGSSWEWLNPIILENKKCTEVWPPLGWIPPVP